MGFISDLRRRLARSAGIHPPANKGASDLPISPGPDPQTVVIPLQQHVGAVCEPMVKVGDSVLVGQKIAESRQYVSAPVHSSVSGEVTGIRALPHPSGREVLSIQVLSDDLFERAPGLEPAADPLGMDPHDIRRMVREGGIVGMGGAGFPTAVKLAPPAEKPIEMVIVNGAECEPYLTGDYRLMVERGPDIVRGARIIQRAVGAQRLVVAIEKTSPAAIEAMRKAGEGDAYGDGEIEIAVLPARYPQGAEKTLVCSVTGREIPAGRLPMDVGVIVDNVGTCAAIYDLFFEGMPLIERVVTVAGDGVARAANLRVRIGTSVMDVIDFCGGTVGRTGKVILGGPMMGLAQYTTEVPVTKVTGGILVLTEESVHRGEPGHFECIRCGRCVKRCPMNLMPYLMGSYADRGMWGELEALNVEDCVECGSCAYVCPARNPLVQLMKVGKHGVSRRRRKLESVRQAAQKKENGREEEYAGRAT